MINEIDAENNKQPAPAQAAAKGVHSVDNPTPPEGAVASEHALAAALDLLPNGLFLVDRSGSMIFCNRVAGYLLEQRGGLRIVQGRLSAATATKSIALWQLIAQASNENSQGADSSTGALKIPRQVGQLPLSIVVTPLHYRKTSTPEERQATAAVLCTDPDRSLLPTQEMLAGLYNLTPAETALVLALLQGLELAQAAKRLSMTLNTARYHLKHVFQKTQTNRQAELMRLMLSGPLTVRL